MEKNELNKCFLECRQITKKHAKTFYFASRFLPLEKRNAAYAIYAVCRKSDDSVDSTDPDLRLNCLRKITEKIDLAYQGNITGQNPLVAFQYTINKYNIPKTYFDELIKGMRMDLAKNRYLDFEELYQYCYRVAGIIGLIMLKVFKSSSAKAQDFAVNLGIAMQLTNILRDIKEDFLNNRIYLPQKEMEKFQINEKSISEEAVDANFISFMQWQISRARKYYQSSSPGIILINDRRCRLVVKLMKEIYAAILDSIEKNNYNIFGQRARVSNLNKIFIALRIIMGGNYR